jgi:D-alanyl-D-alanine carboxypeptidase/D-alanyl-D-alanine-endopeptidase (penicillin-binding protein 4)
VAGLGEPPVTADPVGPIVATPMTTVVTRCNTNSHNLYAEALLKRVAAEVTGEPGSWEAGGAAVRRVVHDRLGSQLLHGLIVSDGSGLSRENRVTAAMLTAWLGSMRRDERLADVYVNSLAVAGESGTLRRRFGGIDLHGAEVRAKSGFINGVSCLSGYVIAPDGRCLCFSVLANDLNKPGAVTLAKRLQERVAIAAAQDLAAVRTSLGSD